MAERSIRSLEMIPIVVGPLKATHFLEFAADDIEDIVPITMVVLDVRDELVDAGTGTTGETCLLEALDP